MLQDHDYDYENNLDNQNEDDDGSQFVSTNPKKKKRNLNRREVNRRRNVAGLERESARKIEGEYKMFPSKPRRDENCKCNCKNKLSDPEKENIYKTFRSLKGKEAQWAQLRGLTSISGTNNKGNKYEHCLHLPHKTIKVCQKYWIGVFGISSRSSILKKILDRSSSLTDGRGLHANHPKIDLKCKASIRRFLGTFPRRTSHYSRHDNPDRKYLDSHLSIAELHRIFKLLFPEHAEVVKYSYFAHIFNTEFNLSFSQPRSDICEVCDSFRKEIASLQLSGSPEAIRNAEQNLKNHWNESEAFYNKLKQARQCEDKSKVAICIDYEKQQPIPKTNIGPEFYKSQLMIQTFCVENIKTGDSTFYLYPENFALKGSEEVVTFLDDYIQNLPPETKELSLWCDNCGGQNKNRNLFAYFQNLANSNKFEKLTINFPVPGHSRLPCDRIFGLLQKHLSKYEKIIQPSDYISCIKKCKTTKPIQIKHVNFAFTDNLKTDGSDIVKVKAFENQLNELLRPTIGNIQKIRSMRITPNADPSVSYTVQEIDWEHLLLIKENVSPETLNSVFVDAPLKQTDFLKVPRHKYNCVQYLLKSQIIPKSTLFFTCLYPDPNDEVVNTNSDKNSTKKKTKTPTCIAAATELNTSVPLNPIITEIATRNSVPQTNYPQLVRLNVGTGEQHMANTSHQNTNNCAQFNYHQFNVRPRAQLRNPLSHYAPSCRPRTQNNAVQGRNSTGINLQPRLASMQQSPQRNVFQFQTPQNIITPLQLPSTSVLLPRQSAPYPEEHLPSDPNSQE